MDWASVVVKSMALRIRMVMHVYVCIMMHAEINVQCTRTVHLAAIAHMHEITGLPCTSIKTKRVEYNNSKYSNNNYNNNYDLD